MMAKVKKTELMRTAVRVMSWVTAIFSLWVLVYYLTLFVLRLFS